MPEQPVRDHSHFIAPVDVVADDDERVADDTRHGVVGAQFGPELGCQGTHRTRAAARRDDVAQCDETDPALDPSGVADRDLDAVEEQREPRQARFGIEQGRMLSHAGSEHVVCNKGLHRNHIRPSLGSSP